MEQKQRCHECVVLGTINPETVLFLLLLQCYLTKKKIVKNTRWKKMAQKSQLNTSSLSKIRHKDRSWIISISHWNGKIKNKRLTRDIKTKINILLFCVKNNLHDDTEREKDEFLSFQRGSGLRHFDPTVYDSWYSWYKNKISETKSSWVKWEQPQSWL